MLQVDSRYNEREVGPLSYMIELPNGMVWKHHIDDIWDGGRSELEPQIETFSQQDVCSKEQSYNEQVIWIT